MIFDNFDIELQGGEFVVSLHPDLLGFVPEELNAAVGMARSLLNDGTFADAVRVRIPADYACESSAPWHGKRGRRTPEPEEDRVRARSGAKEELPAIITTAQWLAYDRERKSYEKHGGARHRFRELPNFERARKWWSRLKPFSFEADYSQWDVRFADGTCRRYDLVGAGVCPIAGRHGGQRRRRADGAGRA